MTGYKPFYHSFAFSTNQKAPYEVVIIEINNELEVFVQISKTDVGFGNNRGRRLRLLQNTNEVFDICTNTSNSLFISIVLLYLSLKVEYTQS